LTLSDTGLLESLRNKGVLFAGEREDWEPLGDEAKGALGGSRGISDSIWRVDAAWDTVEFAWDTTDDALLE